MFRLVNIALGISALFSFLVALTGLSPLLPSRWLLAPLVSVDAASHVPAAFVVLARLGVNLWLPALPFLLLLYVGGLHKRTQAPATGGGTLLAVAWIAHVLLTFLTAAPGAKGGALLLILGMFVLPFLYIGIVVGVIAGLSLELRSLEAARPLEQDGGPYPGPGSLALVSLLPLVLLLLPLFLAPSNPLQQTAQQNAQWGAVCKSVGTRFENKVSGSVSSIAHDWDPQQSISMPGMGRLELSPSGRIGTVGGFAPTASQEQSKHIAFDFVERRHDPYHEGRALVNPDRAYYRFPARGGTYHGVEELSADLLAYHEVDQPGELKKAPRDQGPVVYKLTLSDRRSGKVLGVMTYAVDQANKRACGANVGGTVISEAAFIFDALQR